MPKKAQSIAWTFAIVGAVLAAVLITMQRDRSNEARVPDTLYSEWEGLTVFAEGTPEDNLTGAQWSHSSGEHIGFVTDTPLRFADGVRVVEAKFNDSTVATHISAGTFSLHVPAGKYGAILHAADVVSTLDTRRADLLQRLARLDPVDLPEGTTINSLDEVRGSNTWVSAGNYAGFTSKTELQFGPAIPVRGQGTVNPAAGGFGRIAACGVTLFIPPGQLGYIVRTTPPPVDSTGDNPCQ